MPTPTHQLADIKLGDAGPLDSFVARRRKQRRSWRLISLDLYEITGLDVTSESLRSWFAEPEAEAS